MSDPRFAELLDEYWNVAIKQGWERRSTDDELGSAQDAEHALHQYVDGLTRELAAARDKALEEAAKVADSMADGEDYDNARQEAYTFAASAIRALKEKP